MYVDMSRPVQTLSDLEARNQALNRQQQTVFRDQRPSASSCNQPSASSFHQPISLTEALEADAVRSNSSRLSHSSPPNQPPPTHPGPLPTVPQPPSLSANTQHRRNAKGGKGVQGSEGNAGKGDHDPLCDHDPWIRTQQQRAETSREQQSRTWRGQQQSEGAWDQYRTPVNSDTQHNPHPDHAHAQYRRTPQFSPFKPLNTDERAAWSGQSPNVYTLFPWFSACSYSCF